MKLFTYPNSLTLAGLLSASLLLAPLSLLATPQVEALVHFTGNQPAGGNGALPGGSLFDEASLVTGADGYLYGAIAHGAGNDVIENISFIRYGGEGAIFYRLQPDSGEFETLLRNDASIYTTNGWLQNLTWGSDGLLYSTGDTLESGLLSRWNTTNSAWEMVADDAALDYSNGPWIEAGNGRLYGTHSVAREILEGEFYPESDYYLVSINKDGSDLLSHQLPDIPRLTRPKLMLQHSNGRLYGLMQGVSVSDGWGMKAFFSVDPANPPDLRIMPGMSASMIQDIDSMVEGDDGSLYITSDQALYRIDLDAQDHERMGHETLYTFEPVAGNTRGHTPGSLVKGADGHIYGVASGSDRSTSWYLNNEVYVHGTHGGTIFRWHLSDGFQVVYTFGPKTGELDYVPRGSSGGLSPTGWGTNAEGMFPVRLIRRGDEFYGLASNGGNYGWGTLFRFTPGDIEATVTVNWSTDGLEVVAEGYTEEIQWFTQLAGSCVASTDDPTGTDWDGVRPGSGAESLTFQTQGTWTYTLTCETTAGEQPTLTSSLNITVVSADSQILPIGQGGSFTAGPLFLLCLLVLAHRRRKTVKIRFY